MASTDIPTVLSGPIDLIGQPVVDVVIGLASILTQSRGAPGVVAIFLVLGLLVVSVAFWHRSRACLTAVSAMETHVVQYDNISDFAENFSSLRRDLADQKDKNASSKALWEAWDEFRETIVEDEIDGDRSLRNSIRPSSFLNIEDLGFGPGAWRIVPNLFVSIGLLLTFLGLVAALHSFSENMAAGGTETAMKDFMEIASAKFIMSLVGLMCSIVFTVLLRRRSAKLDRALHGLCLKIERRLVFVSLEDLGFRQLKAATEQREHLREIGMGMVAELQKPLEALPEHITRSIADRMDPIFEKVTSMGTSNMEGLVGDLSTQMSQQVGNSLNRASEALGEATDRIGLMVDRMNASNAQAGDGLQVALDEIAMAVKDMRSEVASSGETASTAMSEGADRLLTVMNDTLANIRDNTAQGADAMRGAADEMRKAAIGFRDQLSAATEDGVQALHARMQASGEQAEDAIGAASHSLLSSFEAAGKDIARLGTEMGTIVGDELLGKLQSVGTELETAANAIRTGAGSAQSAATGLEAGAQSIAGASTSFSAASRELVAAADPVRQSHERIEAGLKKMVGTVETVADTLTRSSSMVAENANRVLETTSVALGTEREGIEAALRETRAAIGRLSEEADKLDRIDEMLSRALKQYGDQLEAALGTAEDHIGQMRDTLAPGIDKLRTVVEQAESFMPAQKRGL